MSDELQFHAWPPNQFLIITPRGPVDARTGVLALHVRTGLAVVCASEQTRTGNQERAAARLSAWVASFDQAAAGARRVDEVLAELAARPSAVEDVPITQEMIAALSREFDE